jgi:hypothetical protein
MTYDYCVLWSACFCVSRNNVIILLRTRIYIYSLYVVRELFEVLVLVSYIYIYTYCDGIIMYGMHAACPAMPVGWDTRAFWSRITRK